MNICVFIYSRASSNILAATAFLPETSKMSSIFLLLIMTGLGFVQGASNSDLNFNFTGYTNVAKLLVILQPTYFTIFLL